ncbi:hypothetical protein R1sor_018515 [Riccia sorocarpa]|uniref:Uncharacterized protein n=1 Tax=Riccia sorocarpa TaxID=122646 RepID=A0ABD3I9W9_9MARC
MSETIPSSVEVVSDRVEVGDDFDSIQDVKVEVKMGDNVSEQDLKADHHSRSSSKDAPKILQADEEGAPVVPPEVAAEYEEEKKIEERKEASKPSNVLREMEVQTGS